MEAQSYTLHSFWWLAIFPAITAVAYYVCCAGTQARRISVASHSIMLLCAFFFSIAVAPWSTHGEEPYLSIFHGMLCLYLLGIALAVARYDGEVAIHGLQIFQALNALLIWGIGDLTITGDGP